MHNGPGLVDIQVGLVPPVEASAAHVVELAPFDLVPRHRDLHRLRAPSEVPANLRPLLSKAKSRSLFVRRFDEEDIKLVLVSRIQLLGTSKQDRERAEKTDEIQRAYNHAVAILRGDV